MSVWHDCFASAVRWGHLEVCRLLLQDQRVADLNIVDDFGDTVVSLAKRSKPFFINEALWSTICQMVLEAQALRDEKGCRKHEYGTPSKRLRPSSLVANFHTDLVEEVPQSEEGATQANDKAVVPSRVRADGEPDAKRAKVVASAVMHRVDAKDKKNAPSGGG